MLSPQMNFNLLMPDIRYQCIYQHFTVDSERPRVDSTAYRGHSSNGPGWVEHWSLELGRYLCPSPCRLSFLCKFLIGAREIDSKFRDESRRPEFDPSKDKIID